MLRRTKRTCGRRRLKSIGPSRRSRRGLLPAESEDACESSQPTPDDHQRSSRQTPRRKSASISIDRARILQSEGHDDYDTVSAQALLSVSPATADAADVIVPFANVRRADVPTVGGKGANLGEMTAAGLPVPAGFILTIDAYRQFYESNELRARIAAELKRIDPMILPRSSEARSPSAR
jgi:Phosphoenolpyruvate synthase/pyruvate phosphate dikinase